MSGVKTRTYFGAQNNSGEGPEHKWVWLSGVGGFHSPSADTGLATVYSFITTKKKQQPSSTAKRAKEDFKQYYHHWSLGVYHQQPAILQNQQEDRVWSSKLHSSNDSSLERRWDQNTKFLERSRNTTTNLWLVITPITTPVNLGWKCLLFLKNRF